MRLVLIPAAEQRLWSFRIVDRQRVALGVDKKCSRSLSLGQLWIVGAGLGVSAAPADNVAPSSRVGAASCPAFFPFYRPGGLTCCGRAAGGRGHPDSPERQQGTRDGLLGHPEGLQGPRTGRVAPAPRDEIFEVRLVPYFSPSLHIVTQCPDHVCGNHRCSAPLSNPPGLRSPPWAGVPSFVALVFARAACDPGSCLLLLTIFFRGARKATGTCADARHVCGAFACSLRFDWLVRAWPLGNR